MGGTGADAQIAGIAVVGVTLEPLAHHTAEALLAARDDVAGFAPVLPQLEGRGRIDREGRALLQAVGAMRFIRQPKPNSARSTAATKASTTRWKGPRYALAAPEFDPGCVKTRRLL
jgi:hypothetical protein